MELVVSAWACFDYGRGYVHRAGTSVTMKEHGYPRSSPPRNHSPKYVMEIVIALSSDSGVQNKCIVKAPWSLKLVFFSYTFGGQSMYVAAAHSRGILVHRVILGTRASDESNEVGLDVMEVFPRRWLLKLWTTHSLCLERSVPARTAPRSLRFQQTFASRG